MINSPEYKALCLQVEVLWAKAGHPKINWGEWEFWVHSMWPRFRNLDVKVPMGDADAPVSPLLDALQAAGALDDDARVMRIVASKGSDKAGGTFMELVEITNEMESTPSIG